MQKNMSGEHFRSGELTDQIKKHINMNHSDEEMAEVMQIIASSIGDQYYALYHIWMEDHTFLCFKQAWERVTETIGRSGNYEEAWAQYIEKYVEPADQQDMYEFTEYSTLKERLKNNNTLSVTYNRVDAGWTRGTFIAGKRDTNGDVTNVIYTVSDINEEMDRKEKQKQAFYEATHDSLTKAFNRAGFEKIVAESEITQRKIGFALFDIDNFKTLNDTYGHDVGDQVLVAVATQIKRVFRSEDKLFRLGGDEFAVLLQDCSITSWMSICKKIEVIHSSLEKQFANYSKVGITLSVGLCFSHRGYNERLYQLADEGLYESKHHGRAGCTLIAHDHKIVGQWRDENLSVHAKSVLEYNNTGICRVEIPLDDRRPRRLICGEATKVLLGMDKDITPEECYAKWWDRIDESYIECVRETRNSMLSEAQTECTYLWKHPKWGNIFIRSGGYGEIKNNTEIFYGYLHTLKDTTLIERKDEKDLLINALNSMYFGTYYMDLENDIFHTFKIAPGEDHLEMNEKAASQVIVEFIDLLVDKEDREKMRQFMDVSTLQERLRIDPYIDCEYRSLAYKGWCRGRFLPIKYNAEGNLTHVLFAISALDSAKAKELDVNSYNKKSLSALFNNVQVGIVMYEWDGTELTMLHVSDYYEQEYGILTGDSKKSVYQRIHPDDVEGFCAACVRGLNESSDLSYVYRNWNEKKQCYNWIKIDAVAKPQGDGTSLVYAVFTDITAQKETELDFQKRQSSMENTISMCRINVTKNTYELIDAHGIMKRYANTKSSLDQMLMKAVDYIVGEENRQEYRKLLGREYLLEQAIEGDARVECEYLFNFNQKHYEWITIAVDMMHNPVTGDIVGVAYCKSSQKAHMLNILLEKTLEQDYMFVAMIFVDTDEFYMHSSTEEEFGCLRKDFWGQVLAKPKIHCTKEVSELLEKTFVKEEMLRYLESHDSFCLAYDGDYKGEAYRLEVRFTYADQERTMLIASMRNITDSLLLEKLRRDNERDPLTGLYNRTTVFEKSRELLDKYPDEVFAVAHIDIKHFRMYNTFFGEKAGDKLLCDLAELLRLMDKDYDHWAYGRIEADVFCIVFPFDQDKFNHHVSSALEVMNHYRPDFLVETAIGLYFVTDRTMSIESMFSRATIAAKCVQSGKYNSTVIYDEEMEIELIEEHQVVNDMQTAIEEEQFHVYLQPKYSLRTNVPVGAEALVRWFHPDKGMVSPGKFIPVFERNGFIAELDRYMWERVCQIIRHWIDEGRPIVPISVNVSRISMFSPTTVHFLNHLIEKYEIDPAYLELELTESAYIDDPDEMKIQMRELRKSGFKILMDDFGSGYSSLNTLRELPVDVLKLDMKFLSQSDNDTRGNAVLSSIVRMSKLLNLPVIAEGVETSRQAEFLRGIGCEYVQGYLFARPMPVADYEKLIVNHSEPELEHSENITMVKKLLADISNTETLIGGTYPFPMALVELENGKLTYLRVNSLYISEFGLDKDLRPASKLIREQLSDRDYTHMMGAYQKCARTKEPVSFKIHTGKKENKKTYLCRAAYEGVIGSADIMLVAFVDATDPEYVD